MTEGIVVTITDEIAVLMDSVADKKRDRAAADKFRRAQADRLRETCSRATFDSFAAAFAAVADDYIAACDARKLPAAFVLENFHLANGDAARLAVRVLGAVSAAGRAMVVLTGTGPETLRAWRESPLHAVRVARVEPPSRAEIAVMATAAGGGDADSLAGFDALVLRACEDAARGGLGAARRVLVGWIHDPDGFPVRVPEALTDDLLEIAYAARQLRSAFPAAGLEPIFRAEGKPAGTWRRALVSLADLGVITSVADPEPAIACFDAFVEARIPRKCESIRSLVRRVLLDAAEAKRLLPSYGLLREIARLGGGAGDDLALDAIEEEVSLGTGSNVLSAITEGHFEAAVGKRLASSLESLVRTRNVLSSASEADIRSIFAAVQPMVHPSLRYEACAAIDRASFDLAAGDSDGAAALGKRAILLLQDRKDSRDIARAYRIIALVELSREKVSDAIDYIGFAAESADHAGEAAEAVLVDACSACIQFVWGNLGKAEREIASAGRRAAALNLDRWERWSRFFGARLRFETGRYQEAMEILDSIAANAGSRLEEAEKRILDAWSFRTRAYASSPYADLESRLDRSGDASFFAIEARFIEGDFKRSVEAADAFLTRPQAPSGVRPFCSPELPDWSSGFAMIEDRVKKHPRFKRYAYQGTPDIRVIVFNKVPVMAMLRLPTPESRGRANLHQGALGVGIDLSTGITTTAVHWDKPIRAMPSNPSNPSVTLKLNGLRIPWWDQILELAIQVQTIVPLGIMAVDFLLDPDKGPMIIELTSRPGLSIQLANQAGLKRRIERVEGLDILPGKGIEVAKALFAERFADKVVADRGQKIVSVFETAKLRDTKSEKHEISAKLDTGAFRSSIDRQLATDLGLLGSRTVLWHDTYVSALGRQQRLEDLAARLHRARGDKHLGHIDLVGLEALADDAHARDQPLVEDIRRADLLLQGLLDHLPYVVGLALDELLRDLLE